MLATVLAAHQKVVALLASAWLADGVTSYAVWVNGQPIMTWPANCPPANGGLRAAIRREKDGGVLGELRVTGMATPGAQQRLQGQAAILGSLCNLEHELRGMTYRLIDTQDQLLALYELTRATRNHLEVKPLLRQLAIETQRLAKVSGAFLVLARPGQAPLTAFAAEAALAAELVAQTFQQLQEAAGEPLLYWPRLANEAGGHNSLLMVPIELHGRVIAGLGLLDEVGNEFVSPDRKLAQAIAEFAGAQIEIVLLYQSSLEQARLRTEMEWAQRVQLRLLPQRPPAVPGLDLWAASRPALQVGGDFYDFIPSQERPFSFAVGDISGKGMAAAMLMAMTRSVIRAKSNVLPWPSPEDVMGRSNEALYDDFTEVSMFATVFVGHYLSESRQLTYANAGHSPVIYVPAGGHATMLEADGTPMGILPVSLSANHRIAIQPGDLLVIATDGLNEARNANDELFGHGRLMSLVTALAHKPAQEIAETLYDEVEAYSAGHMQDDDQTMVVLRGVE